MNNDEQGGRRPGEPLSASLVKALRERSGFTQEQLAFRMGIGGGKVVISGWETGRTTCDGPAAELLLTLFGGGVTADLRVFMDEFEGRWRRAGNYQPVWRQITVVPHGLGQIDRSTFATLFPNVALTHEEQHHGFPPVRGLNDPFGITQDGWVGSIPDRPERVPQYMWVLKRDGRFAYREKMWEGDPMSVTRGHVDLGAILVLCVTTTTFYRKLAQTCGFDPATPCDLRLDLEGMRGRALVRRQDRGGFLAPVQDYDVPAMCGDDHVAVSASSSVERICADAVDASLDPVGELALQLNPALARNDALRNALRLAHALDKGERTIRTLGFLDGVLDKTSK